jgi:Cdc6-like AAA superfamily ATPase
MIVDLEAIEMYKNFLIIEKKGGIVLEYRTDCIRYCINEFPFKMVDKSPLSGNFNIKGYYWDEAKLLPKYKVEYKDALKIEMKLKYRRFSKYTHTEKQFNIIPDVLDSNDFKPLINQILDLKGAFITGIAGSGKSTLVRGIMKELKLRKKKYTCLATTNLAAINLSDDCITIDIHSNKIKSKKHIDGCTEYVIVDEVSMMKTKFYDLLNVIRKFKPDVKIIMSGHFEQFAPVNDIVGDKPDDFYSFIYIP